MNSTGDRDGLMGAVLQLIAPPSFGPEGSIRNKGDKASQKKASRAQVKEVYCEGCGDCGETVLTCTECSVTYHPVCDDPPLDETQIKKNFVWRCRSCRNKDHLPKVNNNNPGKPMDLEEESEDSREAVVNVLGKSDDEMDVDGELETIVDPSSKVTGQQATSSQWKKKTRARKLKPKLEKNKNAASLKRLLKTAVENAKSTNPTLFEIPKGFHINPYTFPGTSRSLVKKPVPVGSKMKPVIVDLENYCIPRPLAICFKCGKSCRTTPLLKCDYCPNFYHFDCLTPPLTTPPVGLWICPLHPEPFLEDRLLKTTRLSERVKLWDMTHQQVDRTSVVLKFLTKCSRKDPPFARKIPWPKLQRCSLDPGDGHIREPVSEDEKIPFMDAAKLLKETDDEYKQKLYLCYYDAIKEFSELDLEGTEFACQNETGIFSKDESIKEKLKYDNVFDPPSPSSFKQKKASEQTPESENNSGLGVELLLEAATMSKDSKSKLQKRVSFEEEEEEESPAQTNHKSAIIPKYYSGPNIPHVSLERQPLMEILLIDQDKMISIFQPQVYFGTGSCDYSNTTVIDPLKYVNCSRLSSQHAIMFFDVTHKQWEILNYSKHGISVDCIRFIIKPKPKKITKQKTSKLEEMKNEILSKRRILMEKQQRSKREESGQSNTECPCYEGELRRCLEVCDNEGSAIVHYQSEIQIGCLRMVVRNLCGKVIQQFKENLVAESTED